MYGIFDGNATELTKKERIIIAGIDNHERYPQRKLGGRREERYPTSWDSPSPTLCVGGESTQGKRSGGASSPIHPSHYEGSVFDTDNHVTYPLTVAQYEHSRNHLIGYNDSLDKPARIVRAKAENILDVTEKETVNIRNYNVTHALPDNGLTVTELFAGGGLMAVGLRAAGYRLLWANDFDKRACEAYAHNLGPHIVHGDITQIDPADIPDADVIAGGPPCQDYSVAGSGAGEDGERGRLVWTYLSIIERKQPKAFVFENVKGLVGKRHRHTFDALLDEFDAINYNVGWRVINAWDYGVAQKRERVFIVGIRKDIGFTFEFPEPEPDEYRTRVLRDVIGDLPEPIANHDPKPLSVRVSAKIESGGYNEYLRKHPPGTMDAPSSAVLTQWEKGAPNGLVYPDNHVQTRATTVKPEHSLSNQRGYVADIDSPGRTVNVCRLDHAEIHPQAPRRFTVRECLRIQSVPDSYVLPDSISLSAQYRIVGNGVASRVAYVIGRALATQLNANMTKVTVTT